MHLPRRLKAAGIHLALSGVVAAVAAAIIFFLWYPTPFDVVSGGIGLFVLVMSVDVIAGPALTAVVASPTKPVAELRHDLLMIATVQLAALAYGIHTVSLARPVLVSFEIDRFRVVSASELEDKTLEEAPRELRNLSWTGPRLIAAVKPVNPDEQLRSIELGMAGIDLSMEGRNWRPYAVHAAEAWAAAMPLQRVVGKYPESAAAAEQVARDARIPLAELRFLPLQSRRVSWVAVIAQPGARIVGYLPVDGFL